MASGPSKRAPCRVDSRGLLVLGSRVGCPPPPHTQIALGLGVGLGVGLQPRVQASSAAPQQPIGTFTLTSKNLLILTQAAVPPQAPPYDGVGDQNFLAAETFYDDGTKAGYLVAMFTTIVEANSSNAKISDLPHPSDHFDVRIVDIVFHFIHEGKDSTVGEQIVVNGQSAYPDGNTILPPFMSFRRAIVGGTRRFFGATGQVTSTNINTPSGGGTHKFQYVLPNVDFTQL